MQNIIVEMVLVLQAECKLLPDSVAPDDDRFCLSVSCSSPGTRPRPCIFMFDGRKYSVVCTRAVVCFAGSFFPADHHLNDDDRRDVVLCALHLNLNIAATVRFLAIFC